MWRFSRMSSTRSLSNERIRARQSSRFQFLRMRGRSADESWMYEEHLDALVRPWRLRIQTGGRPNVVELFIFGPSMGRLALSRMARQRMVGSAITPTTPESRTDWCKETCTETSERKGLNCCQIHLNLDLTVRTYAHFISLLRTSHMNIRVARGLDDLVVCVRFLKFSHHLLLHRHHLLPHRRH